MIEERALVVALEGEQALLEIVRDQPCGLCGQSRGCGGALWSRLLRRRDRVFRAENRLNAQVGDLVVVGMDESAVLRGATLAYGMPLMLLLAGAMLGSAAFFPVMPQDAAAALGGVAGLSGGLFWLRRQAASAIDNSRFRPIVLRAAEAGRVHRICHRGE